MIKRIQAGSRNEWLKVRESYIGGSDAACILGANPWKSNVELWEEKTGQKEPDDISDKDAVAYGTAAEEHLRELFALDFPQYFVEHHENAMYVNSKYPWAHASLDGELTDQKGRKGILEIKTSAISGAAAKAKWEHKIPQNYFIQLLHYMLVTEWDFAVLKAQLKYDIDGDLFLQTRHYTLERDAVESEIAYLAEKEKEFADMIRTKTQPALLLPEI